MKITRVGKVQELGGNDNLYWVQCQIESSLKISELMEINEEIYIEGNDGIKNSSIDNFILVGGESFLRNMKEGFDLSADDIEKISTLFKPMIRVYLND